MAKLNRRIIFQNRDHRAGARGDGLEAVESELLRGERVQHGVVQEVGEGSAAEAEEKTSGNLRTRCLEH